MPKTPDPLRRLQGQRDYYRRAATYDADRVRELDLEYGFLKLEQTIGKALPTLSAGQRNRLVGLLRGASSDV